MANILAVDIGGSKVMVGAVESSDGSVIACEKRELPEKYGESELFSLIFSMAERFAGFAPTAVGVAIPGLANPLDGTWVYAPFSGIGDIPVARVLGDRLGLPVHIENDVNLCALGEKRYGACRDVSDYLWLTVSNGIGGALVLRNELYRGQGMNAGEVGHFVVCEDSENVCGCGRRGCLEAMASGHAIAVNYARATGKNLSAKEISDAAGNGDAAALKVFSDAGGYIGKALAYCVNLLNLGTVVLGGGVMQSMELLAPSIEASLDRNVFRAANKSVKLVKSKLGYNAALVSCAAIC